ncbi:MAG TPA: hypothetical protein VF240_17075 [Pyrinomonadaceae bacterium]
MIFIIGIVSISMLPVFAQNIASLDGPISGERGHGSNHPASLEKEKKLNGLKKRMRALQAYILSVDPSSKDHQAAARSIDEIQSQIRELEANLSGSGAPHITINNSDARSVLTFFGGSAASKDYVKSGDTCVSEECFQFKRKVDSLPLGWPGRFARGLQYQYQRNEQTRSVLLSADVIIDNPQRYLSQHTLTLKFTELFPGRLPTYKRGNDYLKNYPGVTSDTLNNLLCGDRPLITCLTKSGNWFERALMGTSVYVTLSERATIQQGTIVTSPRFGTPYQWNGGVTFDPAKLFPTATDWKGTFVEVQKIDGALAYLGAADARSGRRRPWETPWPAAFIPKVEFKRLSRFDFMKFQDVLIAAPFPSRALNTWTFTWDLTRVIPDTNSRFDADAIAEALLKLEKGFKHKEQPTPTLQKQCILHFTNEDTPTDVQSSSSAETCQAIAKAVKAESYALACESREGSGEQMRVIDRASGPLTRLVESPVKPARNFCKW